MKKTQKSATPSGNMPIDSVDVEKTLTLAGELANQDPKRSKQLEAAHRTRLEHAHLFEEMFNLEL